MKKNKKKSSLKKVVKSKKFSLKKPAPRKGRTRAKVVIKVLNDARQKKSLKLAKKQVVKLLLKAPHGQDLKELQAAKKDILRFEKISEDFYGNSLLPKLPPLPTISIPLSLPTFFGAGVLKGDPNDTVVEKVKKAAVLLVEEITKACKEEATRVLPERNKQEVSKRIALTDLGLEIGRAARKLVKDFLAAQEIDEKIVYQRLTSKTKLVQLVKKYEKLATQSVFE